jgi:hypothetical protein
MGLQIRDDRQMKALTGLSQAQFDPLLSVFSDLYQATQHNTYEEGVASGTRRRQPGGGSKGKLPTMADKRMFVLYYYNPTTSLSYADRICTRRIAAFRSQATKRRGVLRTRKPL